MIYALPILSLGLGGWLGWALGRAQRWGWLLILILAGTALFLLGVLQVERNPATPEFDGDAEIALLFLTMAPLEIGALIGAVLAVIRSRKNA